MRQGWRLIKSKHAGDAFSGDGAAKFGGRWNSPGTPVVYSSSSQSLATLETLVHLNPPVAFQYVVIEFEFAEALFETFPRENLPVDWRELPPALATKTVGDIWVQEARSAVLALPSIIIPGEFNYLLNPAHPKFKISIVKEESFTFDRRLLP